MLKIRSRFAIAVIVLSAFFGCAGVEKGDIQEQKADKWKLIGGDAAGIASYYSPESVTFTDGNIAQVRVKSVFAGAKQKPPDFEEFEYVIQALEIDCSGKKGRPLRTEGFRKDGHTIMDDSLTGWTDIPRGSNSEKLYSIVCSQKL